MDMVAKLLTLNRQSVTTTNTLFLIMMC